MVVLRRHVSLRRKPKSDPVTPEVRARVLLRDSLCLAFKVDPEHVCRDRWGNEHRPDRIDLLTLDHVLEQARMGRRAPSDPAHLVAMCWDANVNGWASAHRTEERAYLRAVSEPEHTHVDYVNGCPECLSALR